MFPGFANFPFNELKASIFFSFLFMGVFSFELAGEMVTPEINEIEKREMNEVK